MYVLRNHGFLKLHLQITPIDLDDTWRVLGATYSRQQTCPILVTKNCVPYWDQQTFRKIREISADFMSPIVVSTNFFSALYWSQKTQNNKKMAGPQPRVLDLHVLH